MHYEMSGASKYLTLLKQLERCHQLNATATTEHESSILQIKSEIERLQNEIRKINAGCRKIHLERCLPLRSKLQIEKIEAADEFISPQPLREKIATLENLINSSPFSENTDQIHEVETVQDEIDKYNRVAESESAAQKGQAKQLQELLEAKAKHRQEMEILVDRGAKESSQIQDMISSKTKEFSLYKVEKEELDREKRNLDAEIHALKNDLDVLQATSAVKVSQVEEHIKECAGKLRRAKSDCHKLQKELQHVGPR